MNFAKFGDRNRKQQYFDKEKITLTKGRNTYNVYDAIQAANVDTNIYDVMRKYHCLEDEAVKLMEEKGGEKGVYEDIRELQNTIKDIGDVQKVATQAKEMFEQLPVEIKQKYGNNLADFFKANQEKKEQEKKEKSKIQDNIKEGVKDETK